MVIWPAIVKYHGDDELAFIADAQAWRDYFLKDDGHFEEGDYLVDSAAQMFHLWQGTPFQTRPAAHITVDNMTTLVRRHMSVVNTCCVTKLTLNSVEEGISLVASTDES